MASLGFWNLIIIAAVAIVLKQCWRWDSREKEIWQNSQVFKHPLVQILRQPVVKLLLQVIIILIVARWLIYTGWIAYRLTQPNAPFWDFKYFYIFGVSIIEKLNLYSPDVLSETNCRLLNECYRAAMVYPPNIILLVWFLGLFSLENASTIWVSIHLLSIIFILWGVERLVQSKSRLIKTLCIIISALIYGLVFDLRVGNITSIITAFLIWTIILAKNGRYWAAGILLGLSTIKPTISLLFIGYFILKRSWKIVFISLAVSALCFAIGIGISGISLMEFIQLYKVSYDEWKLFLSNDPFTSTTRIDLEVIGSRILPQYPLLANSVSNLLRLITAWLVIQFIYQNQVVNNWSKKIELSEVTLIGCLSILLFYSQRHSTAILVLAVPFFVNYLFQEIKQNKVAWWPVYLAVLGILILLTQTGILYHKILEPLDIIWKQGNLPYLVKVTIGTLPNYTLILLTGIILILAKSLHKQVHKIKRL